MFQLPDSTVFFLLGVSLHNLVLKNGEWDLAVFKILTSAAAAPFALALCHMYLSGSGTTFSSALWKSSYLTGSLILGIYLSMIVYRAAFHRLKRFPGPFLARLSNFYITGVVFGTHQEFVELDKLHKRYGDVVRIGECDPYKSGVQVSC